MSRQAALMRRLDNIANNMANTNTTGYKADELLFREYLIPTRSTTRALGGKLSFVQDFGTVRDTREGPMTKTDNPFDLALHDDSFFQVETEAGMRYTRAGHFRTDEAGMLVDDQGNAVMNANEQPVIFAPSDKEINITPDGTIATNNGIVGKLKVVRFDNPQTMRRIGNGLYDSPEEAITVTRPQVLQGMLEESNVQPVVEMTNLISVSREYESNQKIIEAENTRRQQAIAVLSGAQGQAG